MDISALSDSGLVALAQSLHAAKLQDQVGTSVLKLANDQIKQDGENALRLIGSVPSGSLGNNVDVMA